MSIGMIIRLTSIGLLMALFVFVYFKGRNDENIRIANELKEDRITILKDGKKIDDQVLNSDDTGICAILGGC